MQQRRAMLIVLGFAVALLAKLMLTRALVLAAPFSPLALIVDGALVLAVVLLVDLLFPDHRVVALTAVDAVLTAAMLGTVIYAQHYGQVATPALIPLVGQLASVPDAVKVALSPALLLYFADFVVILGVAGVGAIRRRQHSAAESPASGFVRMPAAVYALGLPLIGIFLVATLSVVQLGDTVDDNAVAGQEGLFAYQVATLFPRPSIVADSVDISDPVSVQNRFNGLRGGTMTKRLVSESPGWLEGKNVILIQVEALQTAAVAASVDGVPVMPRLNGFIDRSWYFPNTISNIGRGTTVDAEFAENTSLHPPADTAASLAWADRKLPSLPRLLNERDYDTLTFHANTAHYWNRKSFYEALGWSRYFDSEFFGAEDLVDMGPSDEVLFSKTLEELKRRKASGKPFYAQVITLSTHYPYDALPASKRQLKLSPVYEGTIAGAYLQNMDYVDRAIGGFLDGIEAAGLAQDTVVIVVGDHFGIKTFETQGREGAAQLELMGRVYNEADRMSVPLIVHLPGQSDGVRSEDTAAQVDVMPTVADMLGLDLSRTPHTGRSVFERGSTLVAPTMFVSPGSYVDQNYIFAAGERPGSGQAWAVFGHGDARVPADASAKHERALELVALSRQWAAAQPRESRSLVDTRSIIPK